MYKTFGILGLFLLLVIILVVNPRVIHTIYSNILGRVVLIGFIIFLTMNNMTLGLLAALCLIIASNMFFTQGSYNLFEGLENINTNNSGLTIGDDTSSSTETSSTNKIHLVTKAQDNTEDNTEDTKKPINGSKLSELKTQAEVSGFTQGVDRQTVDETIRSKSSKTLPINEDTFRSLDDVNPSEPIIKGFKIEAFSSFN